MNTLVCCIRCRAHLALSQFHVHNCRAYAAIRRRRARRGQRSAGR